MSVSATHTFCSIIFSSHVHSPLILCTITSAFQFCTHLRPTAHTIMLRCYSCCSVTVILLCHSCDRPFSCSFTTIMLLATVIRLHSCLLTLHVSYSFAILRPFPLSYCFATVIYFVNVIILCQSHRRWKMILSTGTKKIAWVRFLQ